MSKSIFDTRFTSKKMALDAAVKKAFYALDKALNISGYAKDADDGDQQWITIKGAHILIDGSGKVVGGAEGKFNGQNFIKAALQAAEENNSKSLDAIEKLIDEGYENEKHYSADKMGDVRVNVAKELGGTFEQAAKDQEWEKNYDELTNKYNDAKKKADDFKSQFGAHMKGATPAEKRMARRLEKAADEIESQIHFPKFVKTIECIKASDCPAFKEGSGNIERAERNRQIYIDSANKHITHRFIGETCTTAGGIRGDVELAKYVLNDTNARNWDDVLGYRTFNYGLVSDA